MFRNELIWDCLQPYTAQTTQEVFNGGTRLQLHEILFNELAVLILLRNFHLHDELKSKVFSIHVLRSDSICGSLSNVEELAFNRLSVQCYCN